MLKRIKTNKRKGFTLIELIVVMAVLAILVLLAAPKFLGHTKEAQFTKHINNAKVLEDASERYYIDHGKWPRGLDEDVYTPEEVASYAERIYDITGEELALEEGNYWDIDYDALDAYAKLPDESERANYVLRNPVGKVYYLEGLNMAGETRVGHVSKPGKEPEKEVEKIPDNPDVKIGKGEVVSVMEYGNEPVSFSGLSAAAFDGDGSTYHAGSGIVTWEGDLTHREITITAERSSYSELNANFLDASGKIVKPVNYSSSVSIAFKNSGIITHKVVVPEGATSLKFMSALAGAKIYDIAVSQTTTRPTSDMLTTVSTPSSLMLRWDKVKRAIIYKNGNFLADVRGQTYTDKPLYSGSTHNYEVILLDEHGNGQKYHYTAQTSQHTVVFRGLSPAAFDGDANTHHEGSGIVTWTGDLANREIAITAERSSYSDLNANFLDASGKVVKPVNYSSSVSIAFKNSGIITHKVVVPEGATSLKFTSALAGAKIYDITITN